MPQAPSQVALRLRQRPCSGISGAGVMRGAAAPGALRVLCQQRRVPELCHQACRDALPRSGPLPLRGGLAPTPQEDFLQVARCWEGHTATPAHAASLSHWASRAGPCLVHAQWGPYLARASRESPSGATRIPPRHLLGGCGHVGASPGGGPSHVGPALGSLALGGRLWARKPPTPAMPGSPWPFPSGSVVGRPPWTQGGHRAPVVAAQGSWVVGRQLILKQYPPSSAWMNPGTRGSQRPPPQSCLQRRADEGAATLAWPVSGGPRGRGGRA